MDIHSLTLDTRAVTRVTTNKNKGKAASGVKTRCGEPTVRRSAFRHLRLLLRGHSPCSTLVNSDSPNQRRRFKQRGPDHEYQRHERGSLAEVGMVGG